MLILENNYNFLTIFGNRVKLNLRGLVLRRVSEIGRRATQKFVVKTRPYVKIGF
jgi:hypothetical protein